MTTIPTFRYRFIITLILVTLGAFSVNAQSTAAATCSSAVYFGTPQENGGVCVGRGVCGDNPNGINVNFAIASDNPNTLIMTFSLSELKEKQPDQVAYFTDNSGAYMFDVAYNLSADPAFAPLNLPANSQILPSSPSVIQINGDMVIDYIQYYSGN